MPTAIRYVANDVGVVANGSTTERTLGVRFGEVTNVKDFGAKGDGTTDDTAAIQAAIDYRAANSGGIVFVPAGTYIVAGLKIKSLVRVIGEGDEQCSATTIKLKDGANANVFENFDGNVRATEISHLWIDGNRANNTSGDGINHTSTYAGGPADTNQHPTITRVKIRQCAGDCIHLETTTGNFIDAKIQRVELRSSNRGLYIKSVTDSIFERIVVSSMANEGIFADQCSNNHWFKCKTYYNGTSYASANPIGWRIFQNNRSQFVSCEAQEDYRYGMYIDQAIDCQFSACVIDANGTATIGGRGADNTPGTGAYITTCQNCNFQFSSQSFHVPTWQGIGLELVSNLRCHFNLVNNPIVTTAYTVSGTAYQCTMILNGEYRALAGNSVFRQFFQGDNGILENDLTNGTAGTFRLFRNTNNSGFTALEMAKGDGTNTAQHTISVGSTGNAELCRTNGALTLGTLTASGSITRDFTVRIQNTTAPTGFATNGGILYVEGGALKYKGSSGTVTTIAVA